MFFVLLCCQGAVIWVVLLCCQGAVIWVVLLCCQGAVIWGFVSRVLHSELSTPLKCDWILGYFTDITY